MNEIRNKYYKNGNNNGKEIEVIELKNNM